MELRQLEYAVAVADTRHFTRAAQRVRVAQPAVSQQIRRLESELGVELFERATRPVRLTAAGEALVPRFRAALAEVEAAREEVAALRGLVSGRVVVGAMQSVGPVDLAALVAALHRDHPGVDIILREESTLATLAALRRDEHDLGLVSVTHHAVPDGLETRPLAREEIVLALPSAHRHAGATSLALRRMAAEPFAHFKEGTGLRALTEQALAAAGIDPPVPFETNELGRVRELVSLGLCVALLPRTATETPGPALAVVPLRPRLERTISIAWRTGRTPAPAAAAFLRLALARARR